MKTQKGFSLIELLVVIAIIVLLSSIGVIALNSSRSKARDAKRISDIRQVRTALELFYSDEDQYPVELNPVVLGSGDGAKLCDQASGGFVTMDTQCTTTYMANVPSDPSTLNKSVYMGDQAGYDIQFTTEKPTYLGPESTYHAHSETINREQGNY